MRPVVTKLYEFTGNIKISKGKFKFILKALIQLYREMKGEWGEKGHQRYESKVSIRSSWRVAIAHYEDIAVTGGEENLSSIYQIAVKCGDGSLP